MIDDDLSLRSNFASSAFMGIVLPTMFLRRNGSFLQMELQLQRAACCARIGGAVNRTLILRLHYRRLQLPLCNSAH